MRRSVRSLVNSVSQSFGAKVPLNFIQLRGHGPYQVAKVNPRPISAGRWPGGPGYPLLVSPGPKTPSMMPAGGPPEGHRRATGTGIQPILGEWRLK
jgi:hypothetical protein